MISPLDFLRRREKFLILEIAPEGAKGLVLSLDEEKNLKLEKVLEDFSFGGPKANKSRLLKKSKLIVSVDPSLAATISFPVELARDRQNLSRPLSISELENLLSQEIGRIFNQCRSRAGQNLGQDDLINTVLVNSKVDGFKIDGHRVLNPVGFPGKLIQAVLELTFTTRQVFDDLNNYFNAREGLFFTESARSALLALGRIGSLPVNFVVLDIDGGSTFVLDKTDWGKTVRSEKIDWAVSSLFESISSVIPVSRSIVLNFYYNYVTGEVSDNFGRSLMKIMKPELGRFLDYLRSSNLKGQIHLHSPVPLPLALPADYGRFVIDEPPLEEILDKAGLTLDFDEWAAPSGEIFMRLAPFFDFYYDKSASEINEKLRRRLHWLIR